MKKRFTVKDEASILTKRSTIEKVIFGIALAIFSVYSICILYPLFYLFVNSFQDAYTYISDRLVADRNPFAFPKVWVWQNYKRAFTISINNTLGDEIYIYTMFLNSIWYCGIAIFEQVLMSCFTGYAMAKYTFKARKYIWAVVMFSMTIPVVGTTASMFKLASDLNIYNSIWYVILTNLGGWGFNFIVMYGFFQNVSWSYAEAVFLDGGSHLTAFFKIMLPQVKMPVLTLSIVMFIQSWNNYMTPLLYLPDFPTIASGIYQIKLTAERTGDMPYYFAALMLSIVPVIILFSAFSDTIMKNFSIGGLKG